MARFNDLGEGKIEGRKLDPRDIIIREGFNFRDITTEQAQAHIAWLKANIREHGVQQPVRVEYVKGEVFLVDGQCRVEACRQLWKEGVKVPYKSGGFGPPLIPAIVVDGDEAEMLAASMVANGGLPPTKLEFGNAAARLLKLGWTPDKVSLYVPAHIGLTAAMKRRYVTEAVELHQAPLEVKKAVKEGIDGVKISEPAALAATRKDRTTAADTLAKQAKEAKAKGKTEVKRAKDEPRAEKHLAGLVRKMLKEISLSDINNTDVGYISIDRKFVQMLYLAVAGKN